MNFEQAQQTRACLRKRFIADGKVYKPYLLPVTDFIICPLHREFYNSFITKLLAGEEGILRPYAFGCEFRILVRFGYEQGIDLKLRTLDYFLEVNKIVPAIPAR